MSSDLIRGCVSFSLYGDASKYAWGMVENVALVAKYYPGWQCRVYMERGHYAQSALENSGAHVIIMEPAEGSRGMFWRLLAVDDPQFTHVAIRDADSRVNPRDAACTAAWVASGKKLHAIRDHDAHHCRPITGGAWGLMPGDFSMRDAVDAWSHNNKYGDDEEFLWRVVWEHFKERDDFLMQSNRGPSAEEEGIPEHAPYEGFVGEQIHPEFKMPGRWRAVVLSPPHYARRRERFFKGLDLNGGFLRGRVDHWEGSTLGARVVPRHFDASAAHPHYYSATMDHRRILEEAILEDLDYIFVFEDDAMFREDFEEYVTRAWLALPDGWLGLMLGGAPHTDTARAYYTVDGAVAHPTALARAEGCLGMHGMLWNREGMLRAWNHYDYHNRTIIDWACASLQKEEPHFYAPARWVVEVDGGAAQMGSDV